MRNQISVIHRLLFITFLLITVQVSGQSDNLTLEDIFRSNLFKVKSPSNGKWVGENFWFIGKDRVDGKKYLQRFNTASLKLDIIIDGEIITAPDHDSLLTLQNFTVGHTGRYILLFADARPLWRQNTLGYYYIYEQSSGQITALSDRSKGFQMFAKFSPDDRQVTFVRDANLYLYDLASEREYALTDDGKLPDLLNGITDWVYEEEFNLRDGWEWSPDGQFILFYQFDTSPIPEFIMTDVRSINPVNISLRYPLAGKDNSNVRIGIIDLNEKSIRYIETDTWIGEKKQFEYLPRIGWTPGNQAWIFRLNRHQNYLELLNVDPRTGKVSKIHEEKSGTWIESSSVFSMGQRLTYSKDGRHFLWASDRDGYNHIYLYQSDGELVRQVTTGSFDVLKLNGFDEKNALLYFTASIGLPAERHLYETPVNSQFSAKNLTQKPGTHEVIVSTDGQYFFDNFSTTQTPPTSGIYNFKGKLIHLLEDNKSVTELLEKYPQPVWTFDSLKASDGTVLHSFMIKPRDFDRSQKYPLLIYTYGGPTSQVVTNTWKGERGIWYNYLTGELPILIAGIDNRGSTNRGKEFLASHYLNLGTIEPRDQIDAAKKWAKLPFIDSDRIAIWGWSYGGINTLLAISKFDGPDIFKVGIAVAPVSSWELYDTIYTERYLRTPQENPGGYYAGSPLNFVDRLKPHQQLLLIHGDLDDNVHYQNTVKLIEALHRSNKAFHLMIYPGANHSMERTGIKNTKLHLYQTITNFLKEYL